MPTIYDLWGKTNERAKAPYRPADIGWHSHPAVCHMLDVGYVAEVWLKKDPYLLGRFAHLAQTNDGDRPALASALAAVAALHDLGKVHQQFQAKSAKGWAEGYGRDGAERVGGYRGFDHGFATAYLVRNLGTTPEGARWAPYEPAVRVAAGHHGTLYQKRDLNGQRTPPKQLDPELGADGAAQEGLRLVADLFDLPATPPGDLGGAGVLMLLAGFVAACDWLGSTADPTGSRPGMFPYYGLAGEPPLSREAAAAYLDGLRASGRAEAMLAEAGLLPDLRTSGIGAFADLYPFPPRPLQRVADGLAFGQAAGAESVVIEAPMGVGKTEAALTLVARAVERGTARGVYLALPTQASSNGLLGRATRFAERVGVAGSAVAVSLAHGGRAFSDDYATLREAARDAQGEPHTKDASAEVVAPDWLQGPKQVLLAPVGVGTIDQALLGALRARHAFVRLFALAGKVVVLDEVHAYDAYMDTVIDRLLEWLRALGCKVILLSATLPRVKRRRLLEAFGVPPEERTRGEAEAPEKDPYPQILHVQGGAVKPHAVETDPETTKDPVRLCPHEHADAERTGAGAALALGLASEGGCVGWVRNTVREAQEAFAALREPCERAGIGLRLLHARYTRPDRKAIEDDLVARLGPPGRDDAPPRPERMLVVATQTIEQSVDLDFDALVSDLAPVDLLLQRAGRLWRHLDRPRAGRGGHTEPVLHVLLPTPDERRAVQFGPSAWVYDADTLARTAALLGKTDVWTFPTACRTEVARLYDADWAGRLDLDPDAHEKVLERRRNETGDARSAARRLLMEKPKGVPEMRDLPARDAGDGTLSLSTRYQTVQSLPLVLCRADGDGGHVLHATLRTDASPDDPVEAERAVRAATVSVPWYGPLPDHPAPAAVCPLADWWAERKPYDDARFVLLDAEGAIDDGPIQARYERSGNARIGAGLARGQSGETESLEEAVSGF